MEMKVNVFVGAVSNPLKGGWLTLPMDEGELRDKIKEFRFGDAEYEIIDYETDMPVNFDSYRDVFRLNRDLHVFVEYEKEGRLKLLMTAYCYRDEDLEDAICLIESGCYEYYKKRPRKPTPSGVG